MPDMRLVVAVVMGWVLCGMVLCVPYHAMGTMITLAWVGVYVVLAQVVVTVWYGHTMYCTRTHGTPLPKGKVHLRLVTPDYQVCVAGTDYTPTYMGRGEED